MAEILYPDRQRCKTCRKGFQDIVLEGLYCSYRCGRFSTPASTVDEAPRGCKRIVNGVWGYKTRYKAVAEVPEKYKHDPTTNIYLCDNCHTYHIGHSRVEDNPTAESFTRYVSSFEELGSVVERVLKQKGLDKRNLAKVLKVPAVRITEVLEGNPKASPVVLFKILNALHIKLVLSNN